MSYCRFTFAENTINISPKVPRANFQGSDGLCFINICNFRSFKYTFAKINSLPEHNFTENLFYWYKQKE